MTVAPETALLPEVESFLAQGPHKAFVGGQLVGSSTGETFETRDPGSGAKLADVHNMQADDVDRAVNAAARAFADSSWATMPDGERASYIHRLADAVEQRKPIIAQLEALDCGKVLAQAEEDVALFVEIMRYYADLVQHVQRRTVLGIKSLEAWTVRQPWGPCAFIIPWNFPFVIAAFDTAPALAAGNTVVVKPAEDTPLSTLYVAALTKEIGFPDGVFNVVTGYGEVTGAALAANANIKHLAFTGSPEVGREVASVCGRNLVPVKLELGGKGAAVIFDDVDVTETAEKLATTVTFHTGQVCSNASRWLIHENIYDQLVSECVDRLKQIETGYQLDPASQMGPVVSEKQLNRVLGYLKKGQQQGAKLVLEGGKADVPGRDGHYVKPALLAGTLDNVAAREEIFGPVAYLVPFTSESQAIDMANATDYGLMNSVWTQDLGRARRVAESMHAGNNNINGHFIGGMGLPSSGINKSGMGGGVNSVDTLYDYWRTLAIGRSL